MTLTARESLGAWSSCQLAPTASSLEEAHGGRLVFSWGVWHQRAAAAPVCVPDSRHYPSVRSAGSAHGRHEAVDEAQAEATFSDYACPVRASAWRRCAGETDVASRWS